MSLSDTVKADIVRLKASLVSNPPNVDMPKTKTQKRRATKKRAARRLPVIEYKKGRSSTSIVAEVMTWESRCGRYRISRSKLIFEKGKIVYHSLRKATRSDGETIWTLVDPSRATQRLKSRAVAELTIRRHAATMEETR